MISNTTVCFIAIMSCICMSAYTLDTTLKTNERVADLERYVASMEPDIMTEPTVVTVIVAEPTSNHEIIINTGADWFPESDADMLTDKIHWLVNTERTEHGLGALRWDSDLAKIAQSHAYDMAENEYIAHVSPTGDSPQDRAQKAGYKCVHEQSMAQVKIGENIVMLNTYGGLEATAESAVMGWMASDGHRDNIMHKRYSSTGIGTAIDSGGFAFVTQVFC